MPQPPLPPLKKTNSTPKKPRHHRAARLSTGMLLLITGCWVAPIIIIVAISGYTSARATRTHLEETVRLSVEGSVDSMKTSLDSVVDAAMTASYIPTLREAYTRYLLDGNRPAFYSSVNRFLTNQYGRNPMLRATHIIFKDASLGENVSYYMLNPTSAVYRDAEAFYASDVPRQAASLINTLGSNIAFLYEDEKLYMVRALTVLRNRHEPYAALVMEIDRNKFSESLHLAPWVTGATIQLSGTAVPIIGGQPLPESTGRHALTLTGTDDTGRYTFRYTVNADFSPLAASSDSSSRLIALLIGLVIPLIFVVLGYFYQKITHPISALRRFSNAIETGAIGAQIDATALGSAEFNELGANLNSMSLRLKEQFEHIYQEELALRDAHIKALESQIDPHFLGNTLEIIGWESRLAGNTRVTQMLDALSTMIRATLDRSHRPLIHLSEEMMYVNAYLYIIGERLGKRLTVEIDIPASLSSWYVPRLILQPLVENAVEHGIYPHHSGAITLRALPDGENWLVLEVENDAPLSSENETRVAGLLADEPLPVGSQAHESRANIGIRNVHQRLRIMYGGEAGLSVKTTKNNHTISSIRIGKQDSAQFQSR